MHFLRMTAAYSIILAVQIWIVQALSERTLNSENPIVQRHEIYKDKETGIRFGY